MGCSSSVLPKEVSPATVQHQTLLTAVERRKSLLGINRTKSIVCLKEANQERIPSQENTENSFNSVETPSTDLNILNGNENIPIEKTNLINSCNEQSKEDIKCEKNRLSSNNEGLEEAIVPLRVQDWPLEGMPVNRRVEHQTNEITFDEKYPQTSLVESHSKVNLSETGKRQDDVKSMSTKTDFYRRKEEDRGENVEDGCLKTEISREEKLIHDVLMGNMEVHCPTDAKIVRIFTSSTFTDTQHERNYLMENAYCKLKNFCQQNGYQFQVVDMRWGIGQEATNDHLTTELCIKELKLCQKLSTGPNFVTFLSHKYGYRPCPRVLNKDIFQTFLSDVNSDQDKTLILRWYKEDLNSLAPSYILQPIGDVLPLFLSGNNEERHEATQQWYKESNQLRKLLSSAAKHLLKQDEARCFLMSVTEAEILQGILGREQPENHCVWFKRNIIDIDQQSKDEHLSNFKEQPDTSEDFEESQKLLSSLKNDKIPSILKQNILTYDIKWRPKGLDPESFDEHKEYLQKLSEDFETKMKDLIERAINRTNQSALNDSLYEEVQRHTIFCQKKCQSFFGRNDLLLEIKNYILDERSDPLIIYGSSGCGKTSALAMAAMKIQEWTKGRAAVIIRFLGTTLASSDACNLMSSINQQAQYIYSYSQPLTSDKKKIEAQFHECLAQGSAERRLVLILDSLDQLSDLGGGRYLNWLINNHISSPHTKILLSTLPGKQYHCFPKLKEWLKDGPQLVRVSPLSLADVTSILDYWLHSNGRTLSTDQRNILLSSYQSCPLPLYLKLSIDEACQWRSYTQPSNTLLQATVEDSINALFQRTETKHGRLLVSRALGYLTLVSNGLSESELEDILSCDEEVLNDVYMYWTPPIRRLPPLLWVRIKNDLEEYLVNRGSDGIQVLYWYHRQFIQVATNRYCSEPKVKEKLFQGLIDFFSGTWADGRMKPYVGRNGQSGRCDRLVMSQPVQFNNRPNLRKLNILPDLLIQGESLDQLKNDVLLNFNFLFTKLRTTSVMEVLNDFSLALETFPAEEDLITANKAILLSQNALDYDPNQLVTQLIGRLTTTQVLQTLLLQCKESGEMYLEADQSAFVLPGGQLIHRIPAHKKKIISFDMSSDKKMAVTLGAEGIMKFWDIAKGIQVRCFESDSDKPEKVQFCCQDKFVVANPERSIVFVSVQTASFSHCIQNKSLGKDGIFAPQPFFEVCGKDKSLVVFHCIFYVFIWDITSRELKHKIYIEDEEIAEEINSSTQSAGSEIYFALLVMEKILVVHLQTGTTKYIDEGAVSETHDIDGIGLCPVNSILYFGCPEDGVLYSSDLNIWKEDNVRQLRGNKAHAYEKFHTSTDGQSIYFSTKTTLQCWNLTTDEYSMIIPQNCSDLIDFGIVNKAIVVTVSDDRNLRIWDLTLTQNDTNLHDNNYEDVCSGSVRKIEPMENGRYVAFEIGFGPLYWYIYDIWNSKVIMELKLEKATFATLLNDNRLAVVNSHNYINVVDLQCCEVLVEFNEPLSPTVNFLPINRGKEILLVSERDNKLKVFNTQTGYCINTIEGIDHTITSLWANNKDNNSKDHKIGLAFIEQDGINNNNNIYIIDLHNYRVLQLLTSSNVEDCLDFLNNSATCRQVADDGFTMIVLVERRVLYEGQTYYVSHAAVWDIQQGNVKCMLVDDSCFKCHPHVKSASFLSNDQFVLSNHEDNVMRIFSAKTGDLLKYLEHHSTISCIILPNTEQCYLLSCSNEEFVLCLWRIDTFEKLISIKLDEKPTTTSLGAGGEVICGRSNKNGPPLTVWTLHNGPIKNDSPPFGKDGHKFHTQSFHNVLNMRNRNISQNRKKK